MARQSRIVLPDTPHHITQRGNRGDNVFFEKADFEQYIKIMAEECDDKGVAIWAWCLLPNQIQMIAVPKKEISLARALGEAHRRYTQYINQKNAWRGHLFQDRFFSYPMDEDHLLKAARHIERLPVAAGITNEPENYLWSSARAHVKGRADPLLAEGKPLLGLAPDWPLYLHTGFSRPDFVDAIDRHLQTGRPCGNDNFLDQVETAIGRTVRPQKPGRRSITFTRNLRGSHSVRNG